MDHREVACLLFEKSLLFILSYCMVSDTARLLRSAWLSCLQGSFIASFTSFSMPLEVLDLRDMSVSAVYAGAV